MSDPILLWNAVALEANKVSHTNGKNEQTGPTLSSRALAIVHLAMYDAYAGVINDPDKLPRYIDTPPSPGAGASADAAVAAAAHATLSKLFPSQSAYFDCIFAAAGNVSDPGHAFGLKVAEEILKDRAGDPSSGDAGYVASLDRGRHRPDPDNPQGFHAPFYGAQSKGFAIKVRHELDKPPFDNAAYLKALREVRGTGIAPELMGTLPDNVAGVKARTVDETLIGVYWGYDGAAELGTPPRLYNQIVLKVAAEQKNTTADNARLLAFVNVAMADAGILAWEEKYRYDLWRPVVGIREHDKSMGPSMTHQSTNDISDDCDPAWLPFGAPNSNKIAKNVTPPFPAYPSGHATFGAAAFHITRLFYGVKPGNRQPDKLFDKLEFVSDEHNGVSRDNKGAVRPKHARSFPDGLWQMIEENGFSRVCLGVHWIFDAYAVKANGKPDHTKNIGGVALGLCIAEDIYSYGSKKAPKKSTVGPRK